MASKRQHGQYTTREMESALALALDSNARMAEDLANVRAMFAVEDQGWLRLGDSFGNGRGLSWEDLIEWSGQIREAIAGNAHIKAGVRLRVSYVWDSGIRYTGVPEKADGRTGQANVKALTEKPVNQLYFFSKQARAERESALYSDGCVLYLGDDATKTLEPVPLWEIEGEYTNPDRDWEVWAYRRKWKHYPAGQKAAEERSAWYFTDTFKDRANGATSIPYNSQKVPVDLSKTLFVGKVNTHIGWRNGVPDALAALIWARLYKDFLVNGKIMTDALAQIAFQVGTRTKDETKNTAAALAAPRGAGSTLVGGAEVAPLSTAGRGYDFSSGNALAAVVATSIGVSLIHLTSDPGTAGSSYGSAATLDLPTRLATQDRRDWHIAFDKRVLAWMGAPDAEVTFKPLDDGATILRLVQAMVAKWNTGLYSAEEIKDDIEELFGRSATAVPDGVLLPNNSKSWPRADIDPAQDPSAQQQPQPAPAAGGAQQPVPQPGRPGVKSGTPGQGVSTGAGKTTSSKDLRADKIAK